MFFLAVQICLIHTWIGCSRKKSNISDISLESQECRTIMPQYQVVWWFLDNVESREQLLKNFYLCSRKINKQSRSRTRWQRDRERERQKDKDRETETQKHKDQKQKSSLKTHIFAITGLNQGSILGLNGPECRAQNLDKNKKHPSTAEDH